MILHFPKARQRNALATKNEFRQAITERNLEVSPSSVSAVDVYRTTQLYNGYRENGCRWHLRWETKIIRRHLRLCHRSQNHYSTEGNKSSYTCRSKRRENTDITGIRLAIISVEDTGNLRLPLKPVCHVEISGRRANKLLGMEANNPLIQGLRDRKQPAPDRYSPCSGKALHLRDSTAYLPRPVAPTCLYR